MPSPEQNTVAVQNLILKINKKTGNDDDNLTEAIDNLIQFSATSNSSIPIQIKTEEEMNNLLMKATVSSIGSVYKYVGTTTETYTEGSLYVIEFYS